VARGREVSPGRIYACLPVSKDAIAAVCTIPSCRCIVNVGPRTAFVCRWPPSGAPSTNVHSPFCLRPASTLPRPSFLLFPILRPTTTPGLPRPTIHNPHCLLFIVPSPVLASGTDSCLLGPDKRAQPPGSRPGTTESSSQPHGRWVLEDLSCRQLRFVDH
jgi:hypothetical protein